MPALIPTDYVGTITYIGRVVDRDSTLRSEALSAAQLEFVGIAGEAHGGLTRPSCSRVRAQYPRGTTIRNTRQLSIASAEELAAIAQDMGLPQIDPSWVGASLVIAGLPDFTHIPPSSRLQVDGGATLTVDMENRPCHLPAPEIDRDAPGHGAAFKAAAKGRRGVTAWVEREGQIALNKSVRLHIPDQRAWSPAG